MNDKPEPGIDMKSPDQLSRKEIIEVLNKDWMTHDGMWFYHCLQKFGIEKTNQINLAAIENLAQIEMHRFKKLLDISDRKFESFDELKTFFTYLQKLFIPDFMGAKVEYLENQRLVIGMEPGNCFAYKGIKKLGAIEHYRCGVLYRIEVMLKSLGVEFKLSRPIDKCTMEHEGSCSLEIQFSFPS